MPTSRFPSSLVTLAATLGVGLLVSAPADARGTDRRAEIREFFRCAFTPPVKFDGTIVDAALATPELSTLVDAVVAADLVDVLSGDGPFTVYAPSNSAFAALPPALLDFLLLEENRDELVSVLTLHVGAGASYKLDPRFESRSREVATLQPEGQTVFYNRGPDGPQVNQSDVSCQPVKTTNGTVFLIDSVLLPQYLP